MICKPPTLRVFSLLPETGDPATMKTVLPRFHRRVDFNGLDRAFTNIKEAFKAARRPQRGSSDHTAVMLTPVYGALPTRTKKNRLK